MYAYTVQSESTYDPSPAVQAQYEAWRRARDTQSAGMKQEPSHAGVPVVKAEPANVKSELVGVCLCSSISFHERFLMRAGSRRTLGGVDEAARGIREKTLRYQT